MLKNVIDRLHDRKYALLSELSKLEEPAAIALGAVKAAVKDSPVAQYHADTEANISHVEEFGNRIKTTGENWVAIVKSLQCSLKVVGSVGTLYEVGSSILDSYEKGDSKKGKEQAIKYIDAAKEAKSQGYLEEVIKVISTGHLGQLTSTLRQFVIDRLSHKLSQEESKLFMKLAVTLNASSEAYKSYLKTIHDDTGATSPSSHRESDETAAIERIIHHARGLFVRQAQAVHSELGSVEYIRICREIHAATSSKACGALHSFVTTKFGQLLKDHDEELEDLLLRIRNAFQEQDTLLKYIEDMKKVDEVLDEIAAISSLWLDYEGSLQEILSPIYRSLLVQTIDDPHFYTGVLGATSRATIAVQSLLVLYVQLERAIVSLGLFQAIQCDSIDFTQSEYGIAATTSTLVDDVLFLLQRAQDRAFATGDIQVACATVNQVNEIINSDLRNTLIQNLSGSELIYKEYMEDPDSIVSGNWHDMLERHYVDSNQPIPDLIPSKLSFLHCISNIEECISFLSMFHREVSDSFKLEFNSESPLVEETLQSLETIVKDYEQLLDGACKQALNILKIHITDVLNRFNEVDFNMNEEAHLSNPSELSFLDDMTTALRAVFSHISMCYPSLSRSRCIDTLTERIAKFMETAIMNRRFTIYGALYLDSIVRPLMQLCASHAQQTWKHFSNISLITDIITCASSEDLAEFRGRASHEVIEAYYSLRSDRSTI